MNMFREALVLLRRVKGEKARTLQMRLFVFFTLFAIALVGLGLLILTLAGVFDSAEKRHRVWLDTEIEYLQHHVSEDYSKLALRGVALAETLSSDIEAWIQENGSVAAQPEKIEALLAEQAKTMLSALNNNVCSGVFIILDATVNPASVTGGTSRSGLYFKRTETNNLTALNSKTLCLRGPASVARANGVELLGQWRMEFDIGGMDFIHKVLANRNADLSRLYYWSERYLMEGNSEHVMLLSVPLIARDGTVYGVCGIEVSAMMFKRLYEPESVQFPRLFATIAPYDGETLNTGAGFVAGNSYLTSQTIGSLSVEKPRGDLPVWRTEDGNTYTGRAETLRLYPTGSPYEEETWALAVLVPASDWEAATRQNNGVVYGSLTALLLISLLTAVLVSKRYIRPVVQALELIKSDDRQSLPKTQIAEIDDLTEYLAAQDEERKSLGAENETLTAELERAKSGSAAYKRFQTNLETLTVTERAVFNLYMENLTARQIAERLFITLRTVKFHNSNIYAKLGVSSLKELMVYVNMTKGAPFEN